MDPIASFSGLASGIDFRSMVDQIIQVESRPLQLYQERIDEAQARSQAWSAFRGGVESLRNRAEELADGSAFQAFQASVTHQGTGTAPLSAHPTSDAVPGTYQARVLQLATREKLGSDLFATRSDALDLEGEFLIGGRVVLVDSEDSLHDIAESINRANVGTGRTNVTASVLSHGPSAHSLILTADDTGSEGINLVDVAGGVLRNLGFLDLSVGIKHRTSDGGASDAFATRQVPVGLAMGLGTIPPAAEVGLGSLLVSLDLATMSLDDMALAINGAASASGSSVTATVTTDILDDGSEAYSLDISGTTAFADANGILEIMGILEAGRSDVSQVVSSGVGFTDGDPSTVATSGSLLQDLWVGGSAGGAAIGDTLSIKGTRGDGSTFSKTYSVDSGATLGDLVDLLNSDQEGFRTGTRTATASISPEGRLTVTDDQTGGSWLSLEIVAHNEGGGRLDFGAFEDSRVGRAREITAGQDARLEVDGAVLTRSTNLVDDAIPGVGLRLLSASETVASVDVSRSHEPTVERIRTFVEAFNELGQWVADQFSGAGAQEGVNPRPLSGDSILRQMRDSLKNAMLTELGSILGGGFTRAAEIGIEINRDGLFDLDTGKLEDALEADPSAVARFFGVFGSGSTGTLSYVGSSPETMAGNYEVQITQAASRASAATFGFVGPYSDDASPDLMTVQDLGSGSEYQVHLVNGMSVEDMADALNAEFLAGRAHQVKASVTLASDPAGTPATDTTLLQDLHHEGGTSAGVTAGDVITISGNRADGSSFHSTFTVTDPGTQTLGDLRSAVSGLLGENEVVAWEAGALHVSALHEGVSSLALSLTSDNAGGGSLSFGTMDVLTAGRSPARITASNAGGELRLQHTDYGSIDGFGISFAPGGADGTGALNAMAGTFRGLDVQGSIGGFEAVGSGRLLTGEGSTPPAGLMIRYDGADTGNIGEMLFSRGMGSAVEQVATLLLGSGDGSIDAIIANIDPRVDRLNGRIDDLETRLEQRREHLIKKFARLEEALAMAQSQAEWLSAQFANLPDYSRTSS